MNFRQLYDEHFPFVWRSLRRLGIRDCDVPDAVQDVFLIVHRQLPEFEGRSKMSTWIFGICYRLASDRRKTARRVSLESSDEQCLDAPDERVDSTAETERHQGLRTLDALLDEMPLEQRAVFTLFELERMSGEDIAQTLELPLSTVYSRLTLARDMFRGSTARLQARDPFPMTALTCPEVGDSLRFAGGKR